MDRGLLKFLLLCFTLNVGCCSFVDFSSNIFIECRVLLGNQNSHPNEIDIDEHFIGINKSDMMARRYVDHTFLRCGQCVVIIIIDWVEYSIRTHFINLLKELHGNRNRKGEILLLIDRVDI